VSHSGNSSPSLPPSPVRDSGRGGVVELLHRFVHSIDPSPTTNRAGKRERDDRGGECACPMIVSYKQERRCRRCHFRRELSVSGAADVPRSESRMKLISSLKFTIARCVYILAPTREREGKRPSNCIPNANTRVPRRSRYATCKLRV